MRIWLAVVALSLTSVAEAQGVSVAELLQSGYEVKAAYNVAQYSDTTILYLQSGTSLYVCTVTGGRGGQISGAQAAAGYCELAS